MNCNNATNNLGHIHKSSLFSVDSPSYDPAHSYYLSREMEIKKQFICPVTEYIYPYKGYEPIPFMYL